ncbi:MAG: hypothetical protein HKN72_03030 [Gemmatimonadetes bacterium]|nr:hypothetical protein [Gemmatimonadota bacterium]
MKKWLASMAVGCLVVAAWRLPPEHVEGRDASVRTAEEIRFHALEREVRVASGVLFRSLWADSLSTRVVDVAEGGVAVLAPSAGDAVDAQLRRMHRRVADQVEGRNRAGMTFGYVVQAHDHRREDGAFSPRDRTETYVGTRDGVDYCMQVRVGDSGYMADVLGRRLVGTDNRTTPYGDDLGPCRFYLAYGFPGERVQEWLERGAIEFAFEPATSHLATLEGWSFTLSDYEMRRRGPLGLDYLARRDIGNTLDRCLAGLEDACGAFLSDPVASTLITEQQAEIVRRSPATGVGSIFGVRTWVQGLRSLLSDLEEEFGEKAFEAFWTSDAEVDVAFENTFGVAPGAWMVSRIERLQGIDDPGPGVPRHASSASMLTIAAFLGLGYWRRRERRIPD